MAAEVKRVLIVDDEEDMREVLHMILEPAGVDFIDADDGDEGLRKALAEKPDLIILDVQMPRKDGFTVFGELQKHDTTKDIPVIMLTASAERTGIKTGAQDMGAYLGKEPSAYIEKPADPEKLITVVKSLLADKNSMSL